MFFSLLFFLFICYSLPIWGAKVLISFELRKFPTKFFIFHFSLFTFFAPLACSKGTFHRKNKRKIAFSFAFCSLIRTFATKFQ